MTDTPPAATPRPKRAKATPVERFEAAALASIRGDTRAAQELGLERVSVQRYRTEAQSDPVQALELNGLVQQKRLHAASNILERLPEAAQRIMRLICESEDGKQAQSLAVAYGIMADKALQATAHTTNSGRFGGESADSNPQLLERRTLILESLRSAAQPSVVVSELPGSQG